MFLETLSPLSEKVLFQSLPFPLGNPPEEELEGNRGGFSCFLISASPQALGLSEWFEVCLVRCGVI